MITIAFKMIVKNGKEEEFKNVVANQLSNSAKENNCLEYSVYQSLKNTREFMLHEKWESKQAWEGHLRNLEIIFGEKAEGSILPQRLEEYFQSTESISYKEE